MGCLACQRSCPANPRLTTVSSGLTLSRDETRVLLGEQPSRGRRTEEAIRSKLAELGQPSTELVLGRNLRALLDRRGGSRLEASPGVAAG
jgi:hypothetical protein